jgi:hypothetical protein
MKLWSIFHVYSIMTSTDVMHWILALPMRDICGEFHKFLGTKMVCTHKQRMQKIIGVNVITIKILIKKCGIPKTRMQQAVQASACSAGRYRIIVYKNYLPQTYHPPPPPLTHLRPTAPTPARSYPTLFRHILPLLRVVLACD